MQEPIHFINLEFFFRQLIDLLTHAGVPKELVAIFSALRLPFLFLTLLFIVWIVYSVRKLGAIRRKEHEILYARYEHNELGGSLEEVEENERWRKVVAHINSENPADWKMAILEADVILDEMVLSMGYHGENLGERLKAIEQSDFATLNDAWEAHKIRNQIAHQGSDYVLTEREARRVISLYENVFREFKYI